MKTVTRIAAAAILIIAIAGCQSTDSSTQSTAPDGARANVPGMELLTLSDIQAKITLNADQTTRLAAALEKWRQGNELGVLDRAMGKGPGPWMGGDSEPPVHTFLMEASGILSTADMTTLVNLVSEERTARMRQFAEKRRAMYDGNGPRQGFRGRDGQPPHDPLFDDLNLTEDQRKAISDARESLRDRFEPGERRDNVRDAMHEKLKEILTDEQLATLDARRTERRTEMADRMQERVSQAADRRIDFLATVLKLSDDQKARVEQVWRSSADERAELRKSFVDDSAERGAMRDKMESLRDAANASVRDVLTPEQAKLYDALEDMRPMRRMGRGNSKNG